MTQTIKQSGILRLQNAVADLEKKLKKSRVISSDQDLSEKATRIDTEILKALKSENKDLKEQNLKAKNQLDDLITQLKGKA